MFTIPQQCVRHRLVILDNVDKFDNIEGILLQYRNIITVLLAGKHSIRLIQAFDRPLTGL